MNHPSQQTPLRRLTALGIGLALIMTCTSPSWALTETFTNRNLFEAAITALDATATLTNDPFANRITQAQSITFDSGVISANSTGFTLFDNKVSGGTYNNAVDGAGTGASQFIDWTFPMAILGFGADFSRLFGRVQITGNFDGTGDTTFTPTKGFFGIVGMSPFSTIQFSNPTNSTDSFSVDNLVFATAGSPNPTVPEPGTLVLLGTGLAGLAAWRTRKTPKA